MIQNDLLISQLEVTWPFKGALKHPKKSHKELPGTWCFFEYKGWTSQAHPLSSTECNLNAIFMTPFDTEQQVHRGSALGELDPLHIHQHFTHKKKSLTDFQPLRKIRNEILPCLSSPTISSNLFRAQVQRRTDCRFFSAKKKKCSYGDKKNEDFENFQGISGNTLVQFVKNRSCQLSQSDPRNVVPFAHLANLASKRSKLNLKRFESHKKKDPQFCRNPVIVN